MMQKFRLDWNYHSNNIEGNSLTYGETKALILFGITAQGKPLKDHFEITGHNEAINWIMDVVKDETPLTEVFVRELHTLLLKESSYKEAKTSEGKPTRRKIEVGKYKTQPNHVVTVTGEMFYFATSEETPAKMQELVEWFRKEKENPEVSPLLLAALFHYRFIRIHPFDDGNGRVARILMNFILMQFGYPPVIIKTEDKENYYAVLRLADAEELEPFIEYITQNLAFSLNTMISGAKGEEIEEPDDLDKEWALLEARLRDGKRKITHSKNREVLLSTFENSIEPLYREFIITCQKFDRFYVNNSFISRIDGFWYDRSKDTSLEAVKKALSETDRRQKFDLLKFEYNHNYFNQEGVSNFSYSSCLYINFRSLKYRIRNRFDYKKLPDNEVIIYEKLYSEVLTGAEIATICHHKYIKTHLVNDLGAL